MKQMRRAVIMANGELQNAGYARALLVESDTIIVVNGGTRLARDLQVVPDLLIGDHDSLPAHLKTWLDAHPVRQITHPRQKEATDLELALRFAIESGATSILFLGITGGRADHMLANISLLALSYQAGVPAEVVVGQEHLYLVRERLELVGEPGQTVSLLPWGGDARGVHTDGLFWELQGETLPFGPARGISNIMNGSRAAVTVEEGMLLVSQHKGAVA